jgi:hypothetical protein
MLNGSNGTGSRAGGDAMYPLPDELRKPVGNAPPSSGAVPVSGTLTSMVPAELSHTAAGKDDTTMKMFAALATGILIGFIIAKLFF